MNVSAYQVTSNFLRGRLGPGTAGHCVHSSHSSFSRRSFFERSLRRRSAVIDRRSRAGSNEVETGKYSGFWLPRRASARRILFPAFTLPHLREDWPWEIVSSHSSATAPEFHRNSLRRSTTALTKNCRQK